MLDKTDLRPMADRMDMFQHVHRKWNQEADRLTHEAWEKGVTWTFGCDRFSPMEE